MTTAAATSQWLGQHRVERRLIPPFGDGTDPNSLSNVLDTVLTKCRFSPFPDGLLLDETTYVLSIDDAERTICPQFELVIGQLDELERRLSLRAEDLAVGLSVRSRHFRRYEVLERWAVDEVPEVWSPDSAKLEKFQSERGMEFVLGIQISVHRAALALQGLEAGKVICRKVFSVTMPSENFGFPCRWRKFGGDTEYPEEALWVIEWNEPEDGRQYELPVDQVLIVLINEKAQEPLRLTGSVHGTNDIAWKILAADITTQIWADVLADYEGEPKEDDTETLVGQIFARLSRVSGLPYPEIRGSVAPDDSLVSLRNHVTKILRVVA